MITTDRIGSQVPRLEYVPAGKPSDAADDVVEMAAIAGLTLDPWQMHVATNGLLVDDDKRWSAFEVGLNVPRQSGKSALLEALILAALFMWEERTIIYSAHLYITAVETFTRLRSLVQASELADEVDKIYTANGKESIILKNGCRVKFMARSKAGGRGFSGDRIIFDEAYDLPPAAIGAMVPTLAARSMRKESNPQIWYASSAPHSDSVVFHSLRSRAQSAAPGRLYYAEWSAPEHTDIESVDAWYQSNPALGLRISEDFVRDELRAMSHTPGEFLRERLGIPDPLPEDSAARDPKLPADAWAATITYSPPALAPGEIVLSFDIAPGGEWASVAMASGTLDAPYVEVIDHQAGTGWLPGRLVELVERWKPKHIVCDGVGPAGATVGAVLLAFRQAGISADLLHQVTFTELKRACGAFYADVVEGRLRRPANQGPLDNAAADAAERRLGESWAWDRRNATVPISPLVAVTLARSMLSTEPLVAEKPVFAY